jgi:hypothetical protein
MAGQSHAAPPSDPKLRIKAFRFESQDAATTILLQDIAEGLAPRVDWGHQ